MPVKTERWVKLGGKGDSLSAVASRTRFWKLRESFICELENATHRRPTTLLWSGRVLERPCDVLVPRSGWHERAGPLFRKTAATWDDMAKRFTPGVKRPNTPLEEMFQPSPLVAAASPEKARRQTPSGFSPEEKRTRLDISGVLLRDELPDLSPICGEMGGDMSPIGLPPPMECSGVHMGDISLSPIDIALPGVGQAALKRQNVDDVHTCETSLWESSPVGEQVVRFKPPEEDRDAEGRQIIPVTPRSLAKMPLDPLMKDAFARRFGAKEFVFPSPPTGDKDEDVSWRTEMKPSPGYFA